MITALLSGTLDALLLVIFDSVFMQHLGKLDLIVKTLLLCILLETGGAHDPRI